MCGVEIYGLHSTKISFYDLLSENNQKNESWNLKQGVTSFDASKTVTWVTIENNEMIDNLITNAHSASHFAPTGLLFVCCFLLLAVVFMCFSFFCFFSFFCVCVCACCITFCGIAKLRNENTGFTNTNTHTNAQIHTHTQKKKQKKGKNPESSRGHVTFIIRVTHSTNATEPTRDQFRSFYFFIFFFA